MAAGGLTQARSAVYAARQDPNDCTELPAVFGIEGGRVAPLGLRPRVPDAKRIAPMTLIRALVAAAIVLAGSGGIALAQQARTSSEPSAVSQVETWTRKQWAAAKKGWAKDKAKWANCQKQSDKQKLEGRKSWSFLYKCMSS